MEIIENIMAADGCVIEGEVENSVLFRGVKVEKGAKVKNSYIADGCVIDGTVENSIIFRGVKVGKGAVIKNAIILQDTYIGSDVTLNCVITDKNVVINDGRMLSGHQTMPFFIGKGMRV